MAVPEDAWKAPLRVDRIADGLAILVPQLTGLIKKLKLMLFGKAPPSPTEEMRAAYRAAVPALQALIVVHRDPADYEMLGMAYVGMDEPDKGSEIFKKALDLERARNPASDLCGNLMRRVSQL